MVLFIKNGGFVTVSELEIYSTKFFFLHGLCNHYWLVGWSAIDISSCSRQSFFVTVLNPERSVANIKPVNCKMLGI